MESAATPASLLSAGTGPVPTPRTTKACSACSRQKLRCDGSKPCVRCRDLGVENECEFLPSMRGKTRKRRTRPVEISGGQAPSPDVHGAPATTAPTQDGHRRMWERSKSFTTAGTSNSRLWYETPEKGRSPAPMEALPISGDGISSGRTATVDELTSSLPLPGDIHNPLGVLVELADSARHHRSQSGRVEGAEDAEAGGDSGAYYTPLARGLREEAPHIMSLITRYEAKQLFDAYFTHLHPHLPLLDRSYSTPGVIAQRSNFLFNAICCVAARSYNVVLWGRLKEFARFEMERLPKEKTIDVVQGHLIYTWWNLVPPKRFEHDMTWLRAGIAMRTAVDIALHRVGLLPAARQGLPPALLHPMIRTWLLSFITDRTLSMQLGKPDGRQWEEEIWQYIGYLKSSEQANRAANMDDITVAYLAEWAVIVSRAVEAYRIQGLRAMTSADSQGSISNLSVVFAGQLAAWRESATSALKTAQERSLPLLPDAGERILLYERYSRLVLQSLALQYALANSSYNIPSYFIEYQTCAIDLVDIIEQSGKSMWALRGVPDFAHTSLTYAATSLLRCTQSRFAYLAPDRKRIFTVTRRAADLLAAAATESDHIAAVQSAFLSKLISSRDTSNDHSRGTTSSESLSALCHPPPDFVNNRPLQADDFEAFARTLGTDSTLTPWPPIPIMRQNGSDANWKLVGQPASTLDPVSISPSIITNRIRSPSPTAGLQSWLDQQSFSTSGTAYGQGIGELLSSGFSYGDVGGLDDAWWRTPT